MDDAHQGAPDTGRASGREDRNPPGWSRFEACA